MHCISGSSTVLWQWEMTMRSRGVYSPLYAGDSSWFRYVTLLILWSSYHLTSYNHTNIISGPSARSNNTGIHLSCLGRMEKRHQHREKTESITPPTILYHPASSMVLSHRSRRRDTLLHLHVRVRCPSLRLLPLRIPHRLPHHRQNVANNRLVLHFLRLVYTASSNITRHSTSMVPLSESD